MISYENILIVGVSMGFFKAAGRQTGCL
jgi:hypothetical protein